MYKYFYFARNINNVVLVPALRNLKWTEYYNSYLYNIIMLYVKQYYTVWPNRIENSTYEYIYFRNRLDSILVHIN